MFNFYKNSKIRTKIMQRSSIIITYLMLWMNLALNSARTVKFRFGGETFVFGKVGK